MGERCLRKAEAAGSNPAQSILSYNINQKHIIIKIYQLIKLHFT